MQAETLEQRYKRKSEELWGLLDDIDTAPDMFHPSTLEGYKKCVNYMIDKIANQRHKILVSDGYGLTLPEKDEKIKLLSYE